MSILGIDFLDPIPILPSWLGGGSDSVEGAADIGQAITGKNVEGRHQWNDDVDLILQLSLIHI